ncbi:MULTISPECIES: hypothetical protein [unclassified Campylobacter]|uniref:hypothetical protein n=1 Tax=unclassified Campylobacter TaxID=2593542 RepID=UPI001BDA7777|nr:MULTISPECIES: hypothetical protein [unclassified Campylobacter]MBT0881310.1 hypothetical protein [Campylobacter sp. 2018MI27]MBT0885317.1 hypothetical protein [Campylobacter sp. 2018MI10]
MNNINTTLNSLVNSDLGLKQQGNLKPNVKDTKDIKEPLKEGSSLINEALSEDETLELGLKKIVNKLLDGIKSSKDLNQLGENAKNINISKNIAQDIKELKAILSKDKDLEVFVSKLDNLLNTKMQDSKALFQALNNSGVFLESKLRANLNEQALPQSFFRLISFMKNIKTSDLKSEIFKLGQEQMSAEKSLEKLENFINQKLENKSTPTPVIKTLELLKNARAYLQKNTEPLKLIEVANKLEDKINKEIKNLINIEVKNDKAKSILPKLASLKADIQNIKNLAKEIINNPSNVQNNYKISNNENNILSKLENIKEILKNNNDIYTKDTNKIEIKTTKEFENKENQKINNLNSKTTDDKIKATEKPIEKSSEDIKSDLKALQDITKSQDIKQELKLLNNPEIKQAINQNNTISSILNSENLSLQNKIESLTKLLSANLKNEESFKNYINTQEIKSLKTHLNQAKKDINQVVTRTAEHINNSISNDAKSILLQTSKVALAKDNKVAYDMSQKLLNQIELNQIISVANNEVNTYLPYSLDDLDESNISFKSDSEDKFYAQIKLKFKRLGAINIMLGLNQDKYLDINMMIENDNFREILINHARGFKKDLRKAGLITSNFFISKLRESKYEDEYTLDLGFNKKV